MKSCSVAVVPGPPSDPGLPKRLARERLGVEPAVLRAGHAVAHARPDALAEQLLQLPRRLARDRAPRGGRRRLGDRRGLRRGRRGRLGPAVNVIADNALPYFRVNAVAPGFTATALNDFTGHQTVEQGAEVIVHAATLSQDGPTGSFFDKHGPIAW